jgi:hypothetical protein
MGLETFLADLREGDGRDVFEDLIEGEIQLGLDPLIERFIPLAIAA